MPAPPPPPVLLRLRAATAPAHDELERLSGSRRITDGRLTPAEYDRLIDWQARAHRHLEPLVLGYATPEYRYRSRRDVLDFAPHEGVPDLPTDRLVSLGTAYVLEGGSLGGTVILKHLRANPGLASRAPFPFYAAQAEFGVPQWRAYLTHLAGLTLTDAEEERVVAAAVAAFATFKQQWERSIP